jgi:peptidoglycan/LPS O-acetylase OafA/YrhL
VPHVNYQGITRLVVSAKGLVFLLVAAFGVALVFAGRLDPAIAWDKLVGMAMVFFLAVAAEDVAEKFAARPRGPSVQQNVNLPARVAPAPSPHPPPASTP